MAVKPKTAKAEAKAKKKADADGPKAGHNLTQVKKDLAPFIEKLDTLHDDMETDVAGYMADIKNTYDDAKDKLGVPARLIRTVVGEHRRLKKQEAREKEMEPNDRDSLDMLRAALGEFGDMPLAKAAVDRAQAVVDGEKK